MNGRAMVVLMLGVLFAAGCGSRVGKMDAAENALPWVVKAEKKCLGGDYEAAVELYEQALLEHPRAARIHLDLALVLHDHTQDLIGAIHHYRRYVALRPTTEKTEMIDDRIRMAMQQLGAKGVDIEEKAMRRLAELEKENTVLRLKAERLEAELAEARQKLEARPPAGTAIAGSDGSRRQQPPVQERPRTYRVQRGDTLGTIAHDMYGDASKWRDIYEANKKQIKDYDHVPVGLVLTLP